MSDEAGKSRPIWIIAILLAWLVPGAGHVYLGRVRRGLILFVTLSALFWSGVGLGGVMTVDSEAERWWFIADMFAGVHGLVGYQRQKAVYAELAEDEAIRSSSGLSRDMLIDKRLKEKNLVLVHPMDNVARAYAGIAGLLNLLCIFDAAILALMGRWGEDKAPLPALEGKKP